MSSQNDMIRFWISLDFISDFSSFRLRASVSHNGQIWSKPLKLMKPIIVSARRHHNQIWPRPVRLGFPFIFLNHMTHERDDLTSLAQAHLVSQNTANIIAAQQ